MITCHICLISPIFLKAKKKIIILFTSNYFIIIDIIHFKNLFQILIKYKLISLMYYFLFIFHAISSKSCKLWFGKYYKNMLLKKTYFMQAMLYNIYNSNLVSHYIIERKAIFFFFLFFLIEKQTAFMLTFEANNSRSCYALTKWMEERTRQY